MITDELLELSAIFLGDIPPHRICFRYPAAVRRALWWSEPFTHLKCGCSSHNMNLDTVCCQYQRNHGSLVSFVWRTSLEVSEGSATLCDSHNIIIPSRPTVSRAQRQQFLLQMTRICYPCCPPTRTGRLLRLPQTRLVFTSRTCLSCWLGLRFLTIIFKWMRRDSWHWP